MHQIFDARNLPNCLVQVSGTSFLSVFWCHRIGFLSVCITPIKIVGEEYWGLALVDV